MTRRFPPVETLWSVLRTLYAGWFLFFPSFMLVGFHGHVPGSFGPHADPFLAALNRVGFIEPLLIADYFLGGAALLFRRTAPLGVVVLAGPVAVIFLFHVFHTGLIVCGSVWAFGLAALAWRFRGGLMQLWTYQGRKVGGTVPVPPNPPSFI